MSGAACHPRTALAVGAAGVAAGLAGPRGAATALAVMALWGFALRGSSRSLGIRLLPLLSGFALFALLLPFAPEAGARTILRGLAVSLAVVLATAAAGASRLTAELAAAGLPAGAVAFLVVLERHAGEVREETVRALRALALRGGFDRLADRGRAVGVLLAAVVGHGLGRADRVAAALALRGFHGRLPPPEPWRARGELGHLALLVPLAAGLAWEALVWSR
ncbi:MAG TPA: hypothetical protein VLA75_03280 [Thermoanaerobaculia bacterium]|nr:hypothetical protein [Thermoanaerobaculia bacterium]